MIQERNLTETVVPRRAIRTNPRYRRPVVRFLQPTFGAVGKAIAVALAGLHSLVESVEEQRTPRHDYWWDSPETVKHLFNK